jgi:hypothetical protein
MIAIKNGYGRYGYYLTANATETILKALFPLGIFGFYVSSLARMSIGSMLLRFEISKVWRVFLWVMIMLQLALAVGSTIFQLLQCRPISAMWKVVPGAVCWSVKTSQSFSQIYAG